MKSNTDKGYWAAHKCSPLCSHMRPENLPKPIQSNTDLRQKITEICFENGGVRKPMVDKLEQLIQDHDKNVRDELLEAIDKGTPDYSKLDARNDSELKGYAQALTEVKAAINEVYGDG